MFNNGEIMKNNDENQIVKIDETDKKILNLFNKDGRMSYRKISRKLDISIGTVHNRIEKLVKSGVIKKFAPVIDHSKTRIQLHNNHRCKG